MSDNQQKILESLAKNNKCYLCLGTYKDPRMLDCFHAFCKSCLDSYIEVINEEESENIECPLCDEITPKPPEGTESLKKNVYFNLKNKKRHTSVCNVCEGEEPDVAKHSCLECEQDFCDNCLRYHSSISSTREHQTVEYSRSGEAGKVSRTLFCREHVDEPLRYYCIECKELVCQHCNMTHHKQHSSVYASDVTSVMRRQLKKAVESEEYLNYIFWLTDRRQELTGEIKKLSASEKEIGIDISAHIQKWHRMLDAIKDKLLQEAGQKTKRRTTIIKDQIKTVDRNILAFAGVYQAARNISDKADDIEIVNNTERLVKYLNYVQIRSDIPGMPTAPHVRFQPGNDDFRTFSEVFGKIAQTLQKTCCLYDFECLNKGSTISSLLPVQDGRVWVLEGMDGTIKMYDNAGRIHRKMKICVPADDIIRGPEGKVFIACNSAKEIKVFDGKDDAYSLAFTPDCSRGLAYNKGDDTLYVCLTAKNAFFDHDVTHDNRIIKIKLDEEQDENDLEFPRLIAFTGNPVVEYPARIAITNRGFIAISDWKRNCVAIMSASGHVETEYFGLPKESDDPFCPRGLCCDKTGKVFVADYNNHKIMQMDESGDMFEALLSTKNEMPNPWSVAIGPDGLLWVGNKHGYVSVYKYMNNDLKESRPNSEK